MVSKSNRITLLNQIISYTSFIYTLKKRYSVLMLSLLLGIIYPRSTILLLISLKLIITSQYYLTRIICTLYSLHLDNKVNVILIIFSFLLYHLPPQLLTNFILFNKVKHNQAKDVIHYGKSVNNERINNIIVCIIE